MRSDCAEPVPLASFYLLFSSALSLSLNCIYTSLYAHNMNAHLCMYVAVHTCLYVYTADSSRGCYGPDLHQPLGQVYGKGIQVPISIKFRLVLPLHKLLIEKCSHFKSHLGAPDKPWNGLKICSPRIALNMYIHNCTGLLHCFPACGD